MSENGPLTPAQCGYAEYEVLNIAPVGPVLARSAWIYTPQADGSFHLRFSWMAWLLRALHGSDATKLFRVIKIARQKEKA